MCCLLQAILGGGEGGRRGAGSWATTQVLGGRIGASEQALKRLKVLGTVNNMAIQEESDGPFAELKV